MKIPDIYGLVLVGGYSKRMGKDKAQLMYGGDRQVERVWNLVQQVCTESFISCRQDQRQEFNANYPLILDKVSGEGPLSGILAALEKYPDKAWLTLACDMPLLSEASLQQLIRERSTRKPITTMINSSGEPEPLFAIWEPACLPYLTHYWGLGERSPGKFISANTFQAVVPHDPSVLTNINTPQAYRNIISKFKN